MMTDKTMTTGQDTQALISDLENTNTSFLYNEEAGEKRVQFFIGLVTAVIAAMTVLAVEAIKNNGDPPLAQLLPVPGILPTVFVVSLMLLLLVGIFTYLRIVKRDCVTEEYKAISDYRRKQLRLDDPFSVVKEVNNVKDRRVKAGGLAQFVALINSVLICVILLLVVILIAPFPLQWENWVYLGFLGFLVALIAYVCQFRFSRDRREDYENALKNAFDKKLADSIEGVQRVND